MLASIPPPLPAAAMKVVSIVYGSVWFIVALFLKLCYGTALFATLAEITRRINVFRKSQRPAVRAILLLPVVVFFCSAVLFLLNVLRIFGGDFSLSVLFAVSLLLRLVMIVVALGLGAGLGLLMAPRIPMGYDRFGGILYHNRGRYLAFWLGTFSICGLFRLVPWGFVTYWSIWFLLLSAALVTALHWSLYGRFRALATSESPGLPPGDELDLTLSSSEAVALSALLRGGRPLSPPALSQLLMREDASLLAHPAWHLEALRLAADPEAVEETLQGLAARGLCARGPQGWAASGPAARLAHLGHADEAFGLTVKERGAARTVVVQRSGPTRLLLEPGPAALVVRELPPGQSPAAGLSETASPSEV